MYSFTYLLLLVPTTVLALAVPSPHPVLAPAAPARIPSCPVDNITVPLLTGLDLVPGEKTSFISIARGVQNYTCTDGKYVAAGAVANFFDASCIITSLSSLIGADNASTSLTNTTFPLLSFPQNTTSPLPVQFDHFFTRLSTGSIAPVFRDPRTGVEFVGNLTTRVDSPLGAATTIPWLRLTALSGSLAKSVYRTHTIRGQPPATCFIKGKKLSVDYSAMYYFTQ